MSRPFPLTSYAHLRFRVGGRIGAPGVTPKRTRAGSVLMALTMLGAVLSTSVLVTAPASAADGSWIDTTDRQAVIAAYNREFALAGPALGWTGSAASCVGGATSTAHRAAMLRRINYFRSMAGVPTDLTENADASRQAQQAALLAARTGTIRHEPDPTSACYSSEAAAGARNSNLYLGLNGVDAINGYLRDVDASDTGHRALVLHPSTRRVGLGDVPDTPSTVAANALWVFDDSSFGATPPIRETGGFVAWPNSGFVPAQLVPSSWSVMLEGADFRQSTVRMSTGNTSVAVEIVHRGSGSGVPWPTLVWQPRSIDGSATSDRSYRVVIDGVVVAGSTRTLSYDVTVLPSAAVDTAGDSFRPFVNRSFQDFIGRPAEPQELDYWAAQLASGVSRFRFVERLSSSDVWTASVVDQLYLNTLGRPADAAGRAYWTRELQRGVPVAAVAAAFYGSPEYVALQGSTFEPWVADLYRVLLARDVDIAGQTYWAGMAQQRGSGLVAYRLYQSEESRRARVIDLYQTFLGRAPDPDGLAYWAGVLVSGDDLRLAADLASSAEYFARS